MHEVNSLQATGLGQSTAGSPCADQTPAGGQVLSLSNGKNAPTASPSSCKCCQGSASPPKPLGESAGTRGAANLHPGQSSLGCDGQPSGSACTEAPPVTAPCGSPSAELAPKGAACTKGAALPAANATDCKEAPPGSKCAPTQQRSYAKWGGGDDEEEWEEIESSSPTCYLHMVGADGTIADSRL